MLRPAFLQDFANIVIRVTHVGNVLLPVPDSPLINTFSSWRDDEIGMVDDEIPVRLRDGKILNVQILIWAIAKHDRRAALADDAFVEGVQHGRGRPDAVPRHSFPRAGSSYRRANSKRPAPAGRPRRAASTRLRSAFPQGISGRREAGE